MSQFKILILFTLILLTAFGGLFIDNKLSSKDTQSPFTTIVPPPKYPAKASGNFLEICNRTNELRNVASNKINNPFGNDFVNQHHKSTVLIKWKPASGIYNMTPLNLEAGNIIDRPWCSGTRISYDLILTAAHCFGQKKDSRAEGRNETPYTYLSGTKNYDPPTKLAQYMEVVFDYRQGTTDKVKKNNTYPIIELIKYGFDYEPKSKYDFAIVKIGPNSNNPLPRLKDYPAAKLVNTNPKEEAAILIIQHPDGKVKKFAQGNVSHLTNDGYILYENLDTRIGSSGAGIYNLHGQLIGIHTRGGCEKSKWRVNNKPIYANGGILNSKIREAYDFTQLQNN